MIYESTKKLTLSAMFFAVGLILPFFIGQIPMIGQMLLPMHIPVLLCGLIVGWQYGLAVGFFLPLVRSVLFGMPAMFPNAVSMAFELATYGLVIGYLYGHSRWQCVKSGNQQCSFRMAVVPCRCVLQCNSWHYPSVGHDSSIDGCFE